MTTERGGNDELGILSSCITILSIRGNRGRSQVILLFYIISAAHSCVLGAALRDDCMSLVTLRAILVVYYVPVSVPFNYE